jgi:hypothetical protein
MVYAEYYDGHVNADITAQLEGGALQGQPFTSIFKGVELGGAPYTTISSCR